MSNGISISLKITGPGDSVETYGRMISTDELHMAMPEIEALKAKLSIGQAQIVAEVIAGEGL